MRLGTNGPAISKSLQKAVKEIVASQPEITKRFRKLRIVEAKIVESGHAAADRQMQLPMSFLVDASGAVVKVYVGLTTAKEIIADVRGARRPAASISRRHWLAATRPRNCETTTVLY